MNWIAQHHLLEDTNLMTHSHKNFKSYVIIQIFQSVQMFSKYCKTYSEKEMIHWNHTSQVKQKPVNEAIFFFLPC
jgi:hypothetical protein